MAEPSSQGPVPTPPAPIVPIRQLVINLFFSLFVSLVVFVVASYFFLVPQLVKQQRDIAVVNYRVQNLNAQLAAAPTPEDDPQAAEGAAPASDPSPSPAAAEPAQPAATAAAVPEK